MKELERLHKVMAEAGLGSRRKCELLIASGRITVDGKKITEVGMVVDPVKARISYDGELVKKQKKVYYLFNKPKNCVCTNAKSSKTYRAIDFLGHIEQRIYTIGRLDKDSEGLIILTNDGQLSNLLSHPRYGIEKTYVVEVRGRITDESIRLLKKGVWISDGKTSPVSIKVLRRRYKSCSLQMVLKEGKNREIRRIIAKVGFSVISLKRTRIGPLMAVSSLKVGRYRKLSTAEVERLYSMHKTNHGENTNDTDGTSKIKQDNPRNETGRPIRRRRR